MTKNSHINITPQETKGTVTGEKNPRRTFNDLTVTKKEKLLNQQKVERDGD
jgi:hypothetical protein